MGVGITFGWGIPKSPPRHGWALVCEQIPVTRMTPSILRGLQEAGLQPGLRGWQPTPVWVNEQCEVMRYIETVP